ncbi:MAG TPA: metallophosphoesterase [Actinomycetota bacterium]|nr:metallophosphoesterase [Actinomycetota bacterium]
MSFEEELALSLWTTEAARSTVLGMRGHTAASARSAGRAHILATRCAELGVAMRTEFSFEHAQWMAQVSGTVAETGAMGGFFLQRIGAYVDLHSEAVLPKGYWARLVDLGVEDAKEVEEALNRDGIPMPPPPEWPAAPVATAPGAVHTRFGIIGDPHVGSAKGDSFFLPTIEEINHQGVDFSVSVGDLTQNGREDFFHQVRAGLDKLDAPWTVTLGNHDMWGGGTPKAVGLERFRSVFGAEPYGEFRSERVRLIVLNSADPRESPFPPFDLVTGTFTNDPKESIPGGTFSEEVAGWAAEREAEDIPTFIVLHHPPYPYLGFPALLFGLDEPSTRVLEDLVVRVKAWGVICGHTHRCALSQLAGVPVLEVPCPKEWPFGFGVVEVSDEGWAYNLHPVGSEELVAQSSFSANAVFRRYSRGPDEARAFSTAVPR